MSKDGSVRRKLSSSTESERRLRAKKRKSTKRKKNKKNKIDFDPDALELQDRDQELYNEGTASRPASGGLYSRNMSHAPQHR